MNEKRRNWKISVSLAVVMLLMLPVSSMLIDNSIPAGEDISVVSIDGGTVGGITIYVDDSNTAGPWNGTIDYPYQYIQDGIDNATAGDTVHVEAGTYDENPYINKSIDLIGNGKDDTTISITVLPPLRDLSPFSSTQRRPIVFIDGIIINDISVNISGFTVDGGGDLAGTEDRKTGILYCNASGIISDNIVKNMGMDIEETFGIAVYGKPSKEVTISRNNVSGFGRTGIGINGDYDIGPVADVRDNIVTGYVSTVHSLNGIQLAWAATGNVINNTVTHGRDGDEYWSSSGIILIDAFGTEVSNNTVTDWETGISTGNWYHAVEGNDANLLKNNLLKSNDIGIYVEIDTYNYAAVIEKNNFTGNEYAIDSWCYGGTPLTSITIRDGSFNSNSEYAVYNRFDDSMDAAYNYWGHASGPYHLTTNPNGLGDNVSDNVDFAPWLDALYPGGNPTSNLPEISDVHATPASQIAGGYVNITCNVIDDLAVDTVKVDITGPGGFIPVNVSMNEGSYYYNATYTIVGTYDYFIWANDTTGMTNTSSLYAFEIINQPPYTPSDPYPENGSTDISIDADLNWTGGDPDPGDTVYYDIFFGTDPDPPNIEMAYYSTTYNLDRLDYFTQYYWRINAFDNHGYSTTSPVWTFYTEDDNPPDIPSNPGPANESTDNNLFTYLNWTCSDPDPGDTVTYDVYFGTTNPPPMVSNNQSADTYDPGGLSISTAYYWKIRAWDDYGYSATGPTWIFYTRDDTHPDIPSNPSPANNSIDVLLDADLSWTCSDPDPGDTLTYNVFFGINPYPPQVSSDQSTTNYDPGELDYDTQYYWRIEAQDNYGNSSNSPIWTFRTEVYVNDPPNRPDAPDGPSSGRCRKSYTFTASTTDPEGDHIFYQFDWGDGTNSGWIGPYESGRIAAASHAWNIQGSYAIKVQARDEHFAVSTWSDPLSVSMPKNTLLSRYPLLFSLLFEFLEQHPHMFPMLQLLLGL